MEAIVVIILQIFFATCSNELEYLNILFKNSLPSKTFWAYVVFWYCFIDQQVYLSFCHKSKPFPHLDINFNCKQDAPCSFWNWGISLGEYRRIFPSFSWSIFGHVRRLDQSRASENIWWIIRPDIRRERGWGIIGRNSAFELCGIRGLIFGTWFVDLPAYLRGHIPLIAMTCPIYVSLKFREFHILHSNSIVSHTLLNIHIGPDPLYRVRVRVKVRTLGRNSDLCFARSRWLDIGQVHFLHFYGPRRSIELIINLGRDSSVASITAA